MTNAVDTAGLAMDGRSLAALKREAKARSPEAIKGVAAQFEALFVERLLETASQTRLGPGLGGDQTGTLYQSMFNQQIAQAVAKTHQLGLADQLARQLAQRYAAPPAAPAGAGSRPSSSNGG